MGPRGLLAWCPRCQEDVMLVDGRCAWCGASPVAALPEPAVGGWVAVDDGGRRRARCPRCQGAKPIGLLMCEGCAHEVAEGIVRSARPQRAAPTGTLHKGDPGYGPRCPECGGAKGESSRRCLACRRAAGWRGAQRRGAARTTLTDAVMLEALALYASGLSIRAVAERLLERTGHASAGALANALTAQFRRRGWPLRDRLEASVSASYRHGLLRREARDPDLVRAQRVARGEIRDVRCAGVRQNPPGKGLPCGRAARAGSDYCAAHDPALAARRAEHMASMRARRAEGALGGAAR